MGNQNQKAVAFVQKAAPFERKGPGFDKKAAGFEQDPLPFGESFFRNFGRICRISLDKGSLGD